jgi:hypothetical protein
MDAVAAELPSWPSFFLNLTRKTGRYIVLGLLSLIAMGFLLTMNPPHDPDECRYADPPHIDLRDMPVPLPGDFRIARVATPTTFDPFSRCFGGPESSR